jgi:hypothetical protein
MSDDYALMNDHLTVSWFSISPVKLKPGDLLFTIVAHAKTKGNLDQTLQLNSDITNAELYSANDEIFIPKILIKASDEDPLILMAPDPNPWSTACTIPFHVQKEDNLIFTVYNVDGAKLFSEGKYYSPGYHEIVLNADDISANGLLFYTFQSANAMQGGKMFLVK